MAKQKNSSKTAWFVLFILLCIGIIAYGGYRIYTSLVLTPSSSRSSDQQGTDEPAVTDILLAELPEAAIAFS
ncbi:MAG: hypothetical protein LIO46_07945, partial [Clostridiales bacterium]|nr:hypothetical protein [Clostridiales bacterium]